jgi:hypothetical protein
MAVIEARMPRRVIAVGRCRPRPAAHTPARGVIRRGWPHRRTQITAAHRQRSGVSSVACHRRCRRLVPFLIRHRALIARRCRRRQRANDVGEFPQGHGPMRQTTLKQVGPANCAPTGHLPISEDLRVVFAGLAVGTLLAVPDGRNSPLVELQADAHLIGENVPGLVLRRLRGIHRDCAAALVIPVVWRAGHRLIAHSCVSGVAGRRKRAQ